MGGGGGIRRLLEEGRGGGKAVLELVVAPQWGLGWVS